MDEFEYTYLAKTIPGDLHRARSKEIFDIYLPKAARHPQLRIRKSGDTYEITKKRTASGTDSSHLIEETIPLTTEEFNELAALEGKRVHKIRYYYPHGGRTYEIDVFQDALAGLVLVDVEFKTREEQLTFSPPDFCGTDITQEEFIAGGMICGKKYADIEGTLKKFGYGILRA